MERQARNEFLINILYYGFWAAVIFFSVKFTFSYLLPFVIGALAAFIMQKPAVFIESKLHIKRSMCAAVLTVLFFAVLFALLVFGGIKAVTALGGLTADLTGYLGKLAGSISKLKGRLEIMLNNVPEGLTEAADSLYGNAVNKAASMLTGAVSSAAGKTVKAAPEFLISIIISAVSGCYIAADYEGLKGFLRGVVGKRVYGNLHKIKEIAVNNVFKLIKGYALLMLITFLELTAGLMLLKIKYAPFIALLISVIDILPVLGTGTVVIPWGFAELITGNAARGIGLLVMYAVITLVRNFAEPKIIGDKIGINPLFTLLAMFIGLKTAGIAGVLLFPTALIVTVKYYKNEMNEE